MSLYKQLTVLIITLFLLIFAGTYWLNFSSTQAFLNRQMQSQVQDAATALGLTLMPYLEQEDVSGIQTTINAIFDRGFYQNISVYDYDDQRVASREQGVQIEGVPAWFVNSVDLDAPSAEQELSSGWALAGRVTVASNPGYAYQQLWGVVKSSFSAYLAVFMLLLVGGFFALKYLMSPLQALVVQARAICNRQFDVNLPVPRVPELATVVMAMNQMAASVKATFAELSQSVNSLREQAFQDPVTGLGNKRYFQAQLQSLVEEPGEGQGREFKPGSLFLIQLNDFKGFNSRAGYKQGDILLEAVAEKLKAQIQSTKNAALSRLNGGDFAFYLLDDNETEADRLADNIAKDLARLANSEFYDGSQLANIGVATIHKPVPYGSALTRADSALRMAQSKASTTWIRASELDASEIHSMTRKEWNAYITNCVENGKLSLLSQKVVSREDEGGEESTLHREVFLRISDNAGEPIPAGRFIATVEELKLSAQVDREVISRVIEHVAEDESGDVFAINLSIQAVEDADFLEWLTKSIVDFGSESKGITSRLCFEISESSVIKNLESVKRFADKSRQLGCGIGVDQFGKDFSDFGYLNSLKPDYVKLDRTFTQELVENQDSQFLVSSFNGICRSLGIRAIAQAVESEMQMGLLAECEVFGFQGHYIQTPSILASELGDQII